MATFSPTNEDNELVSILKDIFLSLNKQEGWFGDVSHSMWYFNTLLVCNLILTGMNLILNIVKLGVKLCEKKEDE
jgi:hypothetical protein